MTVEAMPHTGEDERPLLVRARRARPEDIGPIVALSADPVAAGTLVSRDQPALETAVDELLVVDLVGVVSAAIGLGRRDDDLLIYNFCVGVALRGRGVGTQLVDQAFARAIADGCRALIAFGSPEDTWFERRGFRQVDDEELAASRARLRSPGRRSVLYERPTCPESVAI
jgi:N-acetylglutamate synthase-like GNAT family acetyltransferase